MVCRVTRRTALQGAIALAVAALSPYRGWAKETGPRSDLVESLLGRMTLAEKAGQLSCFSDQIRPSGIAFNPDLPIGGAEEQLARIRRGEIGMLFNGVGARGARAAQVAAVEGSRLGIPLLFAADIVHGLRTIFPLPIAEACAFDPDLAERTAAAAAREAAALGIHWTFAPMVDVARDQRWGRVAEGSGGWVAGRSRTSSRRPSLGSPIGRARE